MTLPLLKHEDWCTFVYEEAQFTSVATDPNAVQYK